MNKHVFSEGFVVSRPDCWVCSDDAFGLLDCLRKHGHRAGLRAFSILGSKVELGNIERCESCAVNGGNSTLNAHWPGPGCGAEGPYVLSAGHKEWRCKAALFDGKV